MIAFKIDSADVILNDLGDGQGKIIISDDNWGYNFSYFWGSIGGGQSLIEFLIGMDEYYFSKKLGPSASGEINSKGTIRSVRRAIKEYFSSEYPWYKELEFQKDLRYKLNRLERNGFSGPDEFFHEMNSFVEDLDYYNIDNKQDRENIESIFKSIFCEPWYYLVYDEHREITYLKKFKTKLVKELKKQQLQIETIKQYNTNEKS
jgi:hypothetical protein